MVRLKDVGKIITGNTPKTSEKENYESNDICFVKPSDIESDGISYIEETENFIAECAREKARILPVNSVLVTCIGIIGKIGINKVECAFNQQINAIVPNEEICLAQYLAYAIKSKKFLLQDIANAPVVPILNKTQFADVEIKIVDLKEQESIVHKLAKVEALLEQRKQQLQKLDELVKARFVEMFGAGVFPLKKVEELCSDIVDCPHTTPKYTGELKNPAIRTSEIKKGYIIWESMRYVSDEEYKERISRLVPAAGDIVYGREGTFGNAAILPDGYKFCLGQRVMLLRPNFNLCTSEYLLYAVISDEVYRQAKEKNNASTVAHVNVKDVKQFKVALPPIELQKEFGLFLQQIDKSKLSVQKSLEKLETLKKALMQKYFG